MKDKSIFLYRRTMLTELSNAAGCITRRLIKHAYSFLLPLWLQHRVKTPVLNETFASLALSNDFV